MKAKRILWIVAVIMILSIFSISLGADKFYYGSLHVLVHGPEHIPWQRDSLKFNIGASFHINQSNIEWFADNSMRAIPENPEITSPTYWSRVSHYTLWEAEGLEGSYYKLSYNGGTLVNDPSASGGKAMRFTGPGTPGIIQWGPTYYQEPGDTADPIKYTAEFRLKYMLYTPLGPMAPGPPTPLCSIMVVDRGTILKDTVLYKSDFAFVVGYKTFKLEDYTVLAGNKIEFQIYWFGIPGALYIDYVKVYDENGEELMRGTHDQDIMDYVSQDWVHTTIPETGETVVYRWCLKDEPFSIDLFATNRYVDSLLREVSPERVGNQAFNHWWHDTLVNEYFLRRNPEEYTVDIYPTRWWGHDSSGVVFQQGVSRLTKWLNTSKNDAETRNRDLWVIIQTFLEGKEILAGESCCPGCSLYYEDRWYCSSWIRLPSPNEVRLQTFLALCYGADAILHFCYSSWIDCSTDTTRCYLMLALWDYMADSATGMWREIKNFTGPRVEALGPVFNQLTWQGACSDDSVGSFILRNGDSSYIDNIVPYNHYPPYVEVGFFTDASYYDYFVLVNRRCLSSEGDSFRVFIEKERGQELMVIDMYTSTPVAFSPICADDWEFTVYLEPGEGRLFSLIINGSPLTRWGEPCGPPL
ncbi:MAG: hypothetical protein ACE5K2_03765 [Candidatus Zixiibacteriota bacterium]